MVAAAGFQHSRTYWESRYRLGGDSGAGSGGIAAAYKADVLNTFVHDNKVHSVIEFGCGDGRQLALARYPNYVGVDVAPRAIDLCRRRFASDPTKTFILLDDYMLGHGAQQSAALSMSLDVIFHLVEDDAYQAHLDAAFKAGERFVIVYSTSVEGAPRTLRHVRHRNVVRDVRERFSDFERAPELEVGFGAPAESGEGGDTRFFVFRRIR